MSGTIKSRVDKLTGIVSAKGPKQITKAEFERWAKKVADGWRKFGYDIDERQGKALFLEHLKKVSPRKLTSVPFDTSDFEGAAIIHIEDGGYRFEFPPPTTKPVNRGRATT